MQIAVRLIPKTTGRFRKLLIIIGVMGALWGGGVKIVEGAAGAIPPYNFVIIMTDDQRWDTLWAMPIVQEKLIRRGVHFTQAFVSTPLCCPARASFLGGGYYAHNTGVLTNSINGGVFHFVDTNTLPFYLQQHGYKTGLIGKYLNGYPKLAPYIPPGWTRFITMINVVSWTDFEVVTGASGALPSTGGVERKTQYLTDYLRDEALTFLDGVGDTPFFLYFTPSAPHVPATPAPGDEALFASYLYRGRGYGETNRRDKPAYLRHWPFNPTGPNVPLVDEQHRNELRSLQAVDRAVGLLVDKLQALGKLDNTMIVFTSDNGLQWEEHGLRSKGFPYEESIRIPLIVVLPGVFPRNDNSLVVMNLDVPTTVWNLAGLPKDTDGLDLLPLLHNRHKRWRPEGIFLESFGVGDRRDDQGRFAIWAGWRTRGYKYVEYVTGEKELYDLIRDPFELKNIASEPHAGRIIRMLRERIASLKGLAITVDEAPEGTVGVHYVFRMTAWGGTPPYTWTISYGTLPEGLTLNRASGVIRGMPVRSQAEAVLVNVQDSSIAKQTHRPQKFDKTFTLTIDAHGIAEPQPATVSESGGGGCSVFAAARQGGTPPLEALGNILLPLVVLGLIRVWCRAHTPTKIGWHQRDQAFVPVLPNQPFLTQ